MSGRRKKRVTQPLLPFSPVRNSGLLSEHWLEHRLKLEPEWAEARQDADEALTNLLGLWRVQRSRVERCGAAPIEVHAEWGQPIDPADVERALRKTGRPKLLAVVHAETSTGVRQPLEDISKLAHDAGALFVVDTVTSLGGIDVRVDEWHIDAVYSGTQKCLSAPPGLSPVSFSPRAVDVIGGRNTPVQSWYLDVTMIRDYWGAERAYHHTAPISSIYALHEALTMVLEEGLQARFERHVCNHRLLTKGLDDFGFKLVVDEEYRLPMLNAVTIPDELDDRQARIRLLEEFNIEVGGGLGDFAGKVWRIGLMGESATRQNVDTLLRALRGVVVT